jgi:hypothetical protein
MGETVAFLAELEFACLRPAGYIRMSVQDDLGTERWVTPDLDRNVAPLRIHDVERVVVDIRLLLFEEDAA